MKFVLVLTSVVLVKVFFHMSTRRIFHTLSEQDRGYRTINFCLVIFERDDV